MTRRPMSFDGLVRTSTIRALAADFRLTLMPAKFKWSYEWAADMIDGLLAINASLRNEIRTQRKEIAALRNERAAVEQSERPFPDGGWVT